MVNTDGLQARSAGPDDVEPMLQVLCAAFGIDPDAARPLIFRDPFFDLSHKRILVSPADGVVSCLTVIPSSLWIGQTRVPVGGIAGVATHPSFQRRGYAGLLLAETVAALAENLSYPLAALFPYSYPFYRRFGWEIVSRVAYWYGPSTCLPRSRDESGVRPVRQEGGEDRAAIHRLHEAGTRSRTGAFLRDARRWEVIEDLTPARQAVVYESQFGAVEGYLFFEWRQEGGVPVLAIHEMHGVTESARRALVGFLAGQKEGDAFIEWESSPETLLLYGFFAVSSRGQKKPQITLRPGMMLRLVDLAAALSCLHEIHFAPIFQESARALTLRASDPQRPQNEAPLRIDRTGIHSGSTTDRDWLAAPITVLAQLYCGYRTPSEALTVGDLAVSSAEALALADALFPPRHPFVSPPDQF